MTALIGNPELFSNANRRAVGQLAPFSVGIVNSSAARKPTCSRARVDLTRKIWRPDGHELAARAFEDRLEIFRAVRFSEPDELLANGSCEPCCKYFRALGFLHRQQRTIAVNPKNTATISRPVALGDYAAVIGIDWADQKHVGHLLCALRGRQGARTLRARTED
jgi:hypothetical protein